MSMRTAEKRQAARANSLVSVWFVGNSAVVTGIVVDQGSEVIRRPRQELGAGRAWGPRSSVLRGFWSDGVFRLTLDDDAITSQPRNGVMLVLSSAATRRSPGAAGKIVESNRPSRISTSPMSPRAWEELDGARLRVRRIVLWRVFAKRAGGRRSEPRIHSRTQNDASV